jgi:hypothetical protein
LYQIFELAFFGDRFYNSDINKLHNTSDTALPDNPSKPVTQDKAAMWCGHRGLK